MYLKYRKNYFSQNGEDGILAKLLKDLKIKNNITACEFGAWDGKHYSNTYNLNVAMKNKKLNIILFQNVLNY